MSSKRKSYISYHTEEEEVVRRSSRIATKNAIEHGGDMPNYDELEGVRIHASSSHTVNYEPRIYHSLTKTQLMRIRYTPEWCERRRRNNQAVKKCRARMRASVKDDNDTKDTNPTRDAYGERTSFVKEIPEQSPPLYSDYIMQQIQHPDRRTQQHNERNLYYISDGVALPYSSQKQ